MAKNRRTKMLDLLDYQIKNLVNYPNIQTNTFNSLQRELLRYRKRTFGVKFIKSGSEITAVRFLVLAVHGKVNQSGNTNTRSTGNNIIFIANHLYSFSPGTPLVLFTGRNINTPLTVMRALGSGGFEVNENLREDILTINDSGKDLQSAASFPYVELRIVNPSSSIILDSSVDTSFTGGSIQYA